MGDGARAAGADSADANAADAASTGDAAADLRVAIVAPTYHNERTLRDVLDGLDPLGLPIIVVDDGCTDDTPAILRDWLADADADAHASTRHVRTHEHNRGKAAALRTGFEAAADLGCTHVLTIDTDGQLDPAEAPAVLAAAAEHPDAMIVGCRDDRAADYPRASRIGRRISNVLVRLESGARVGDSQCGYRVYPLETALALPTRGGRYEYETECLVRAAWAGIPIVSVPVTCRYELEAGRVSHFRKGGDTWRSIRLHARLLARSHVPPRVPRLLPRERAAGTGTLLARLLAWINPVRAWEEVRRDGVGRTRFSAAFAVGVFIANVPIYGFQTAASLLVAKWFRLHPLPVVVGAHLSTPPIGPVLGFLGIGLGHRLLHGTWPSHRSDYFRETPALEILRNALLEWFVGGTIIGIALGVVSFVIVRITVAVLARRPERPRPA